MALPASTPSGAAATPNGANAGSSGAGGEAPVVPRVPPPPRRVTYSLPPRPTSGLPYFALPPPGLPRHGRSQPLLESLPPATPPADAQTSRAPHPQHTLPVTSLALDTSTCISDDGSDGLTPRGILYTGARDGLVASWELGLPMRRRAPRVARSWRDRADIDENGMRVEQGGRMSAEDDGDEEPGPIPMEQAWQVDPQRARERLPSAKFRQCVQSHTDWVNDMLLCNMNQTLVSAGSDGSVRMWNPHDARGAVTPELLGTHLDYVRALTHAREPAWVASGGFDSTVKLWDIRETREDPIISLPASEVMASVYALSTNAAGTVLAGGTPERVVRTWDPRSGKRIASLIGHTDNIRSLVVSDDGRYLLSASSDASIRLWSLGEQRCLHTFTHHSESVWSLHSSHPTLDVFYSGDRMGYVCKVDWERCAEPAEGECVVLFKDSGEGSKTGVPRARKDNMGIHKIIAQDDAYVWTAGGSSSVARWNDVPSRMSREALYPISSTVGNSSSQALLGAPPRATDSPAPPAPSLTSALKSAGAAQGSPSAASVSFAHKSMDSPGLRFQVPSHLAGSNLRAASGSRHRHTLSSASQATSTDVHELAGASQHHPAATLYGIPFDSLVSLAPPASESYAAVTGLSSMVSRDPDSGGATSRFSSQFRSTPPFSSPSFDITQHMSPASPIPASLLSETTRPKSTRSASIRFAPEQEPLPRDSLAREASNEAAVVDDEEAAEDAAIEARQAYEERDAAPDAIPLYSAPADVIEGTHGLIRTSMLNDRRHVLTIDTAGVVAVWDIVKGACLGVFRTQDVVTAARDAGDIEFRDPNSDEVAPADALNLVRERIEGEAATLLWCTADVRGGLLSVHLEELRAFDAEIYLDDCDFVPQAFAKEDQRINMGKLVLRNLFDTFVSMEYKLRSGPSPPMRPGQLALDHPKLLHSPPSQISIPNGRTFRDLQRTPGMTIALAEPPKTPALLPAGAAPLTPSASRGLASLTSRTAAGSSGAGAPGSPGDYFSLPNQSGAAQPSTPTNVTTPGATSPAITTAAAPTSGGLMSRLRIGKNRKGDKNADVSASKADEKPEVAIVAPVEDKNAALRQLLSQPVQPASASEIPTYSFLADTTILVEQAPEPGSWQAQYRGLVRTVAQDAGALEAAAPLWLLDFLLHNRGPTRDPSKISFTLAPWIAPELRGRADGFGGYGNISGSTPVPLPELPSGGARLTATRMLRIKKSCAYVAEKLELAHTSSSRNHSIAGSRRPSVDPTSPLHRASSGLSMTALANAANAAAAKRRGEASSPPSAASSVRSMSHLPDAVDLIEILCNDIVLPLNTTLAEVQRFYWRSSGDPELRYRSRIISA